MTMISRMRTIAVAALAPALLGGCYMNDGLYGGVSVGAGDYYGGDYYGRSPYGYDPYGGYYGGHGYGWYDNYYYPGNGRYIYDRSGRRHAMREQDRAYWQQRREARGDRPEERLERRQDRFERRQDRIERRDRQAAVDPAVIERRQARREARRSEGGVFNREARQAIRQAARGRDSGGVAPQEP